MKKGLLLINLGTPSAPDVVAVRRYLREFLSDKRVIDLPWLLRYFILYAFILPFRPRVSAKNYQAIWTKDGSPLLTHGLALAKALSERLGQDYNVELGMRYGEPSLKSALDKLSACSDLTILPLYPQYSSAATGSSIDHLLTLLHKKAYYPSLKVINEFYQHPDYIHAQAALIQPFIADHDYILFSYHGIPERHLHQVGCRAVCQLECPLPQERNPACYRAQCQATTKALAKTLNLQADQYGSSFQSRLGKTIWIQPYTDKVLTQLRAKGVKRLAVTCPSFVADCLETLEEIGIRARQQWLQLGGEELSLIPSLNASELWIDSIVSIINDEKPGP